MKEFITVPLTDAQFAALVSFAFNAGAGALRGSTLRQRLNAGDYDCVPTELAKWVKAMDPGSGWRCRACCAAEGEIYGFRTQPTIPFVPARTCHSVWWRTTCAHCAASTPATGCAFAADPVSITR